MNLQEPLTVLTDYLLSGLALIFFFRLKRRFVRHKQLFVAFWAITFLMIAAGALGGGTAHGFKENLPENVHSLIWKGTLFSIGIASFSMLSGALITGFPGVWGRRLVWAAAFKLGYFIMRIVQSNEFLVVILDYLVSMGVVLALMFQKSNRYGGGALWISGGILISFAGAGIQQSNLFLGPLNHNDLYHVVQMFACFFLYKGVTAQSESFQTIKTAPAS